MDLNKLKSIRKANRSVVTRHLRKIDDLKNEAELARVDLLATFESVEQKKKLLEDLNQQIISAIDAEDIEEEILNTDEYTLDLETKLKHLRIFIQSLDNSNNHTNQQSTSSYQTLNYEAPPFIPTSCIENQQQSYIAPSLSTFSNQTHHLPKLTLPNFSGNIIEWQSFWDSFESAVHMNPSLPDIQKFNYLKSQLGGETSHTIDGFALTNANYKEAINVLKERYGQASKITQAHMKALLDITPPNNDLQSLHIFYDRIEASVRGLEALGQSQDTYGTLLVPIILSKLPGEVRQHLARDHGSNTWILHDLRKAIQNEISIIEAGQDYGIRQSYATPTCTFLTETKSCSYGKESYTQRRADNVKSNQRLLTARPCIFCQEIHAPTNCTRVTDTQERKNIVKRSNLCFNCLGTHRASECKSKHACRYCKKKHHTSLCNEPMVDKRSSQVQSKDPMHQNTFRHENGKHENSSHSTKSSQSVNVSIVNDKEGKSEEDTKVLHTSHKTHSSVLLKTAVAPVWSDSTGIDANIFFDEGAQRSFITEALALKLKLEIYSTETIQLACFGDTGNSIRHLGKCTLLVETQTKQKIPIEVLVVPKIAVPLQNHVRKVDLKNNYIYLQGLNLAHPITDESMFEITVLIGADYYWQFIEDKIIRGDGPTAVKSKLGYLLSGPLKESATHSLSVLNMLISHKTEEFDIASFWNLESMGINSKELDQENEDYLKTYQNTCIEFQGGQYIAKLPWKREHDQLPTHFSIAKRRTESVIRRLDREPGMLKTYDDIIKNQELKGFIEKIEDEECDDKTVHYIPHHPVRKDSLTTPIRIVYDCSCRQSDQYPSLNDCLMNTPPVLNDLTKLLLRFRLNAIAISTDIEKAFLHVGLHEHDRDATRFLWMSDAENINSKLVTYRFKSVLFGATCSPFILSATLLKHVQTQGKNSDTAKMIEQDIYVDNIISSVSNENKAVQYYKEVRELMTKGGFNLRSWTSNSQLLRTIACADKILDKDTKPKVLGMRWDVQKDELYFAQPEIHLTVETDITKREILKQSSKIYDPLGLLSPITIRAKLFLQELWRENYEWDEILPTKLCETWIDIATNIQKSIKTAFPRRYFTGTQNETTSLTLHVFSDASLKAYGSVAYLCNGNESKLIMAKTRVAPVKSLTLPQLELMAAVIGARLTQHILSTFTNISNVELWSDSQIVLHWLMSKKPLKRFIANRVTEINELTRPYRWRYCPTDQNPADILTRGITATQYTESMLWRHGPSWIIDTTKPPVHTIEDNSVLSTLTDNVDVQQPTLENRTKGIHDLVEIERFSSYKKLLRTTAYVLRFIQNCRISKEDRTFGSCDVKEIQKSAQFWIRSCQILNYPEEYDTLVKGDRTKNLSRIRQLNLFLDQHNIIRCKGRIENAPIPESAKFPILLPANTQLTALIVRDAHENLLHSGTSSVISHIRQNFWIPCIRQFVNKILRKCTACLKVNGTSYKAPDPPPLPKARLQDAPPFTVTGIDFTGALHVRDEHKNITKAYVCLFTCASTRGVHLEVLPNLSAECFMQAFRRFTSRRSTPKVVITDNALTFVAASKEIKQIIESQNVQSKIAELGVQWRFIPNRAPWYGGFWERLIAVTKTTLKKVLEKSLVDFQTLCTIVTEVESVMNDRPLTYTSTNINDSEPLTPSHLLCGRKIRSLSYPLSEQDNSEPVFMDYSSLTKQNERQRELFRHCWTRWKNDYVTSLCTMSQRESIGKWPL